MGERLPEAWMVEWHRNQRVEFPLRRWAYLFPSMLPFALIGLGALPRLFYSDWRVTSYVLFAVYVVVGAGVIWQLITQRPVVVVDHRGIHYGRRRFMAWDDISSIDLPHGPRMTRQLPIHPKDVWAKRLVLTQNHVSDLESFRTWLTALLTDHRQTPSTEAPTT
ncbi:hypothetical protein GCM10010522_64650 [Kribbella solani]|uniref:hypothetical protein n=1 Tax=Kribbella solani TaxID=236067 RepID=UPI001610C6C3|nr:hypothetical protein [Kribbella solani]